MNTRRWYLGIVCSGVMFCGCGSIDFLGQKTPCKRGDYAQCKSLSDLLDATQCNMSEKLRAVPYIEKFCDEDGNGKACEMLAASYRGGGYVPKDYAKALEYYKKACDTRENDENCLIYEVNKDFLEKKCFEKADLESCRSTFFSDYADGYLMVSNIKHVFVIDKNDINTLRKKLLPQYIKSLEKACDEQKSSLSCSAAAEYHDGGYRHYGIKENFTKWLAYKQKACKLGDTISCAELNKIYKAQ